MNFFARVRQAMTGTKASAAAGAISHQGLGQPVWTPRKYDKIADEAFKRNAVAYHCIKRISSGCASVPWLLHGKGGKEITEHKLLDLLRRPNPRDSGVQVFEALYAYVLLAGNTYLEEVSPSRNGAPPRELWNLRPDRMKVLPGPSMLPQGYEYDAGGQKKVRWQMDPLTGQGPILHIRDFNPLDDWYGMSRIEPAAYGIDRHNSAGAHNKALLDNQARPSGALIYRPIRNADGSSQSAPEEVIKKAKERLTETHGGAENAGRPLVLSGDVDWKEMGFSPRDMDFAAGKDDAAWDIAIALGYPPILLVKGQATYNNIREAKLELWEETNLPLIELVASSLNRWLAPRFGDDLVLSPDLDSISALEPRREAKRNSTRDLVKDGIISADEGREALQYGPRPVADVKKVDAGVVTALYNAVPDAGYEPLVRYLRSVGLYDPSKKLENIIAEIRNEAGMDPLDPEEAGVIDAPISEDGQEPQV